MAYWQNNKGENRQIDIQAHYYDLLEEYENDHPGRTEYDFIKNEIDFYEPHIKELEDAPSDECFTEEAKTLNLIEKKRHYNFFRDKLDAYNARVKPEETINDFSDANVSKKSIPYKIALLNEIGFFDLPKLKALTQEKQIKILKNLIGGTSRQIKGNINVLNPHSKDDRTRYTSFSYESEVSKFIKNLSN